MTGETSVDADVLDELDVTPICDRRKPLCGKAATWYVAVRCPVDGCEPCVWLACDRDYAAIRRHRRYQCGPTGKVFTLADAITAEGRIGGAS